jgi:hypothetical protein
MAIAAPMAIVPGQAQESQAPAGSLSLELNNARETGGSCRLTYVAKNETDVPLEKTSYEIVVFDSDERVSQFLILEFGSLPAGKTKVVEFDFPNRGCAQISRILVNEVSECLSASGETSVCMDALRTSTRTEIAFGL